MCVRVALHLQCVLFDRARMRVLNCLLSEWMQVSEWMMGMGAVCLAL